MPSTNLKPEDEAIALEADKVYRTTYMFSATMPPAVERMAKKYLRQPVVVTIGRAGAAGSNVTQRVRFVKENAKPRLLQEELQVRRSHNTTQRSPRSLPTLSLSSPTCFRRVKLDYQERCKRRDLVMEEMLTILGCFFTFPFSQEMNDPEKQCIVFVNTKNQCTVVARQVERLGHYSCVLHGGKAQDQREVAIRDFKAKRCNVLVATDVAGRGIDVADVSKVVNYDVPHNMESYVALAPPHLLFSLSLLTHSNALLSIFGL